MTLALKLQKQSNSIRTALTGLIPSRNNSESFRISGKQLLSQLPWAPWPSLLQARCAFQNNGTSQLTAERCAWWASCMPGTRRHQGAPGVTRRYPGGTRRRPMQQVSQSTWPLTHLAHLWEGPLARSTYLQQLTEFYIHSLSLHCGTSTLQYCSFNESDWSTYSQQRQWHFSLGKDILGISPFRIYTLKYLG